MSARTSTSDAAGSAGDQRAERRIVDTPTIISMPLGSISLDEHRAHVGAKTSREVFEGGADIRGIREVQR